ncbi:hypothetical protein GCM10011529_25120 [Polymorphobacter glacialis]|uniref:Uncharacterized protein n=1 Tax=Sandarakinorhabdus glacialis TaxID=1614636 RepID=A0A916ZZ12_9SPHN|nr:hypothetical protein GCM10011529_25120 [Polymorphobacter glacialis]
MPNTVTSLSRGWLVSPPGAGTGFNVLRAGAGVAAGAGAAAGVSCAALPCSGPATSMTAAKGISISISIVAARIVINSRYGVIA